MFLYDLKFDTLPLVHLLYYFSNYKYIVCIQIFYHQTEQYLSLLFISLLQLKRLIKILYVFIFKKSTNKIIKNQELRLLKTLDLLEPLVRIERTTY